MGSACRRQWCYLCTQCKWNETLENTHCVQFRKSCVTVSLPTHLSQKLHSKCMSDACSVYAQNVSVWCARSGSICGMPQHGEYTVRALGVCAWCVRVWRQHLWHVSTCVESAGCARGACARCVCVLVCVCVCVCVCVHGVCACACVLCARMVCMCARVCSWLQHLLLHGPWFSGPCPPAAPASSPPKTSAPAAQAARMGRARAHAPCQVTGTTLRGEP